MTITPRFGFALEYVRDVESARRFSARPESSQPTTRLSRGWTGLGTDQMLAGTAVVVGQHDPTELATFTTRVLRV